MNVSVVDCGVVLAVLCSNNVRVVEKRVARVAVRVVVVVVRVRVDVEQFDGLELKVLAHVVDRVVGEAGDVGLAATPQRRLSQLHDRIARRGLATVVVVVVVAAQVVEACRARVKHLLGTHVLCGRSHGCGQHCGRGRHRRRKDFGVVCQRQRRQRQLLLMLHMLGSPRVVSC